MRILNIPSHTNSKKIYYSIIYSVFIISVLHCLEQFKKNLLWVENLKNERNILFLSLVLLGGHDRFSHHCWHCPQITLFPITSFFPCCCRHLDLESASCPPGFWDCQSFCSIRCLSYFLYLDVVQESLDTLWMEEGDKKKQLSLRVKSPPNNETFMLPDDICSDGCVLVLTEYHFILPTFNLLQNSAILLFPSTILTWNHSGLWKNSPLHYQASQIDTLIPTQIS